MKYVSVLDGSVSLDLEEIMSYVHAKPDDTVWIAGSLMDGFGSPMSDVDVYVACERRPSLGDFPLDQHHRYTTIDDTVATTADFLGRLSFTVDVQYRTYSEIESMFAHVRAEYGLLSARTKVLFSKMRLLDQKLVYRIYNALPLFNQLRYEAIRTSALPQGDFCYVMYRNGVCSYPEFRDIIGAWRGEHLMMGCERARDYVRKQMRAFTHLNGNTNSDLKWTLHAALRLPVLYDNLVQRFKDLMDGGTANDASRRDYIVACLDLADDLFDAGRPLLDTTPGFQSRADARAITEAEMRAYRVWHPELTREFAYRSRLFSAGLPALRSFLEPSPGSEMFGFSSDTAARRFALTLPQIASVTSGATRTG